VSVLRIQEKKKCAGALIKKGKESKGNPS